MQRILSTQRTIAVSGVRRESGAAHMRHTKAAPQRLVCSVASLENVDAQMDQDDSFDKDAAYRRFEELLGDADVSFNQGDKVRLRTRLVAATWRRTSIEYEHPVRDNVSTNYIQCG